MWMKEAPQGKLIKYSSGIQVQQDGIIETQAVLMKVIEQINF